MALLFRQSLNSQLRSFKYRSVRRYTTGGFENLLGGEPASPVQVKTLGQNGIVLTNGMVIPSACVFLEGQVFLWNVPQTLWKGWTTDHFQLFEVVVPKPEILLFGTGKSVSQMPPVLRSYLSQIGIHVDVMDTWGACTTYNMLTEEGRRVSAALMPYEPRPWSITQKR